MNKLEKLNYWANSDNYYSSRSAQSYLKPGHVALASSGCGSACGSQDGDAKPKPSACGASDEESKPKPSACGADDDTNKKPSACGSSCGSEGK